mmetsp:Transcript_29001/g.48663  ORF Transcript_29001/g.48663 Transcript_29001/m.48663 type:complete len:591 (+) Transcript_29001:525-2297(+)|eukprot:CAMPEP_0198200838 /NCGR_PEP_ID=MMETSP1445-20131203/3754_1 /TAXON_ID=36898 /ORGANISM="Pyramimonas sp., Strain CCMP2087" /LENGTH=590 /DNA_ID=CAMNT_0043870999 /DNA_START=490 /DNA_END=2262 /DNA_ORIENTATION=+
MQRLRTLVSPLRAHIVRRRSATTCSSSFPTDFCSIQTLNGQNWKENTENNNPPWNPPWIRGFATTVVAATTVIAATATVAEAEPSKKGYDFPPVWFGLARGIHDQYIIDKEIGKGSYGDVYKCMHKKEKKHYAVKILDKKKLRNAESIEDIDRELEMLRLIQGQANIITLKGSFEDTEKVYLVMELCEGGDLYDHIDRFQGKFTESDVADIVSQILAALAHCHLKGVVICDIKPDNFLFDTQGADATLKAIDFGLSRRFTPGRPLRRAGGTAYFVAPEVLRYEYGPESDMWSVGVIAYMLLTGRMPFDGETEKDILLNVLWSKGPDYNLPEFELVSPEGKALVKSLLNRDAGLRPSASSALAHSWIRTRGRKANGRPHVILDAAVLSALKTYSSTGLMRKMAVRAMAREMSDLCMDGTPLEAVSNLKAQFEAIDTNTTGTISIDELKTALEQSVFNVSDRELKEILEGIDLAGEGEINYLEFLAAAVNLHQLQVEHTPEFERLARLAFDKFDLDKSGHFTASELKEALLTTRKCYVTGGDKVTDAMIAQLIAEVDTDGDGQVSFEEFLNLLAANAPTSRSRYGWIKSPGS